MFTILLKDKEVKVIVEYKKNKNTYFRFQDANTIKVTASKKQSIHEIKKYIKVNQDRFYKKLSTINTNRLQDNEIRLFGSNYKIAYNPIIHSFLIDREHKILYLKNEKIELKSILKEIILNELHILKSKYLLNNYIDIKDITFKTRYMKTRHGSCNPIKKTININLYLIQHDLQFLEYVFLHEIAHLNEPNHGKKFYQLLGQICPNYIELRKELRKQLIYRW